MFGVKKKESVIHVSFIDEESQEIFAVSDVPTEHLPESFEAQTTLYMCDRHWEVVKAEPVTSTDFIKSGKLKLVMRQIIVTEGVDLSTLLFSLPTISNELPAIGQGSTKLNKNVFELREDDWRQHDILPTALTPLINENLSAISEIYKQKSCEVGEGMAFKELHVRQGLDRPFEHNILKAEDLFANLPQDTQYDGISFAGVAGVVENGFAVKVTTDLVLYGVLKNGEIHSLSAFFNSECSDRLTDVLQRHNLCLVDWCGVKVYE